MVYNRYDLENLNTVVKDIRGEQYEFVDYFYKKDRKLMLNIKHKNCGNTFTTEAYNFLKKKTNCTKCSKNRKLSKEDFIERIKEISNDEYSLVGDFNCVSKKVLLFHKTCKNSFEMLAESFIQGQRCPHCNPRKNRGHEDFKIAFDNVSNGEYTLLSKYISSREKVKVQHNVCGTIYDVMANNFLRGHKCAKCFKGRRITQDQFKEKLENIGFFNNHILLSKFQGTKNKITVKHLKCGTEFQTNAGYIYRSPEICPKCSKSYGERKIEDFLNSNNILFESQKKFDECKDKHRLLFDFYIKSENLLIEYDGEQHFKPIFGKKQFTSTVKHDSIKNDFAKSKGISLLRISYNDFDNIEEILKTTLKL